MKYYDRLTLSERGNFSNRFSFFPIRRVGVSESHVEILTRGEKSIYQFSDLSLNILERSILKSYGLGGGWIRQRVVEIRAPDKIYKIDMSAQFPDLDNNRELLRKLKEKISHSTKKIPTTVAKRRSNIEAALLLILLVILYRW